ncbi:urease accessory protein UreD [Ramlibacter sp. H39-3-26]|uniref:urease accessory protein UreD n=1 Tax=Curvibacter soli TaxID=3031331 RepID=UPI0023DAFB54|nr:urease accessory protein UreD [Ramlibacter sp. H39-3-26]MDF1483950.1 urease accessory protein UreD [Ramlibacter sp. H39-3-26]
MPWHARLALDYRHDAPRTTARFRHEGPLRILQSLYPEGDGICHNVLVHPPGGLVGGDRLDIRIGAAPGAHGLVTTPGATRFYRTQGEHAVQDTRIDLQAGARLEWLPLEALCFDGCEAENHLRFTLAPGAELIGWDVAALGLPHAGKPFLRGSLRQHLEMPGVWLERGRIAACDRLLLDSPLGLAGRRCTATLFLAAGTPLPRVARERALEAARAVIDAHALRETAGATSPDARIVVVRALGAVVEPAMQLLKEVRAAWRAAHWGLPATAPRIWAM